MIFLASHVRQLVQIRIARRFRWGLIKSRSDAERTFENLLKEMNLPYIQQAIFLDPSTFFIVDFFVKRPHHLAIEIDGANHRQTKSRIARDAEQAAYFQKAGLKLIRFTNDEVFDRLVAVRTRLESFLSPEQTSNVRLVSCDEKDC